MCLFRYLLRMAPSVEAKSRPKSGLAKRMQKAQRGSWVATAKAVWESHGSPWVEPAEGAEARCHVGAAGINARREADNPHYAMLTSREKFNLHMIESIFDEDDGKRAFVVSRSSGRSATDTPVSERYPCITEKTKIWLDWRARVMTGAEKMMVQGFLPGSYDVASVSDASQSDLAGNAVGVNVCAAINMALMEQFLDVL